MLHKLLTEYTKIKAVFARNGYRSKRSIATCGDDYRYPSQRPCGDAHSLLRRHGRRLNSSTLTFDPRAATSVRYGDDRVLPSPIGPGDPRLLSGLVFLYEGQYVVALFEIPGHQ
jgi:hypothetical protein